jgi:fatty-acyl-CoA synthase
VPCAFIELRPNTSGTEVEIRQFCREQMAGYKVPKRVVFGPDSEERDRQDPEVHVA